MRKPSIYVLPPCLALMLAGCVLPSGAGGLTPPPPSMPSLPSSPSSPAQPLGADEAAAVAAVAMAATEAVLAGSPAAEGKAEAPFTTLAVGDRLPAQAPTPTELKAKLQGGARGTYAVDLTKLGTGAAPTKVSAEPATATVITYAGLGDEPLHGLTTELRGVTVDPAARTLRARIAEGQGVVLVGGKNLFGRSKYAAMPFMKGALAAGFGVDAAHGSKVSYELGVAAAGGTLTLPYALKVESETVPQLEGDLTLALKADKAAQALTVTLKGPYTVRLPGAETVLKAGTLDETKTTTLTEAKARFLEAAEALGASK